MMGRPKVPWQLKNTRKAMEARARMSASYEEKKPLTLKEVPVDPRVEASLIDARNTYVRAYELGECSVLVTKEGGSWHVSIAHPRRYPTWDEVAEARYRLVPDDVTLAMLLPPRELYVNLHKNCFQMIQVEETGDYGFRRVSRD